MTTYKSNSMRSIVTQLVSGAIVIITTWTPVRADTDAKYCDRPADAVIDSMCKISKSTGIPVMQLMVAQSVASMEASATHCSFTLTAEFFSARDKVIADPMIKKAYAMFLKADKEHKPSTSLAVFCPQVYQMLGPSNATKIGPDGKPGPVFYKR